MGARRSRSQEHQLHHAVVEEWLRGQASSNTQAAYRSDLAAFGQWCAGIGAIPLTADTNTLVQFQTARAALGDSAATVRRRWSALSSFYDFAVAREALASNPTAGVTRPRDGTDTVARLSGDDVATCRVAAAALDCRLAALVGLIVSGGCKVGEALQLDIPDVARRSATTVTMRRRGEAAKVEVDAGTAGALRQCIGGRREGPVFLSERGSTDNRDRLTRFGADYLMRQLRTDDPDRRVTANELRRFYVESHEGSVRAGIAQPLTGGPTPPTRGRDV